MEYKVECTRFEDDGAYWTRLWATRETSSGLPYLGHGITFCGATQEQADQRAAEFLDAAKGALK